ncbi:MAG: 50S ribosomal protein L9 [Silvanigrellales bacterium]|nr:50S ribosomal protein L9 [Silvanigrellales bacterium]
MLVLLQANVPSLGHIGDLVNVKPGFARNFLFPRKFAIMANAGNKKELEHNLRIAEQKKAKALAAAKELANQIASVSLTIQKPVGEEDKIFGTVTNTELSEAFKAEGFDFDRRAIAILDDIKRVGVYRGTVKLHPEVVAEFKIWVVAQAH